MILRHTATRAGKLSSFLRGEFGLSYGLMKGLKYRHAFQVNGLPAHTNHPVRPGDVLTVRIEEALPALSAEDGPLSIVFEDESLLVLDKPAGIIMHPTFNRTEGTLANSILGYYQRTGQPCAVHFVNRLDRDTFGLVLIAKNAHVHAVLCEAMRAGSIVKAYHAIVFGCPADSSGLISQPIARSAPTSLLRCVRADGKEARTGYQVLAKTARCAHLLLQPITGRTHQLRVHCAHEGFPILGDPQYGTEASKAFAARHGVTHQQLCAVSLTLPHPLRGDPIAVRSGMSVALPED